MPVQSEVHDECCYSDQGDDRCGNRRLYPWVGEDRGMVVLFSAPGRGIVLHPAIGCDVVCGWEMCRFKDFCGKVCIANCKDHCKIECKPR